MLASNNPAYSFWVRTKLFVRSPLIIILILLTIAAYALPWYLGCLLISLALYVLIAFHYYFPAHLLYEISLTDLIVRNQLTHYFPSLNQSWWSSINSSLLLGGLPLDNRRHPEALKKLGITAVVSILEDFEVTTLTFFSKPTQNWKAFGIKHSTHSCKDMQPPTLTLIHQAIGEIESIVARGGKVYLHCKAGRGRSALIAICYLIKTEALTASEALTYVKARRPLVNLQPSQINRIQEYENTLSSHQRSSIDIEH